MEKYSWFHTHDIFENLSQKIEIALIVLKDLAHLTMVRNAGVVPVLLVVAFESDVVGDDNVEGVVGEIKALQLPGPIRISQEVDEAAVGPGSVPVSKVGWNA